MSSKETVPLGIDLGNTYTRCFIYRKGKQEAIQNDLGNRQTPSIVSFQDSKVLIGDVASGQVISNPANTITDIRDCTGLDAQALRGYIQSNSLSVVCAEKNAMGAYQVLHEGETRLFTVEEILVLFLSEIKAMASRYLKKEEFDVVISAPPMMNDKQRQSLRNAVNEAGMKMLRVCNDPTMSVVAYDLDNVMDECGYVVFDMSKNKMTLTAVLVDNGIIEIIETKSSQKFGCKTFDTIILDHFVEDFNKKHKCDMATDSRAIRRLCMACEKVRIGLENEVFVNVDVPALFNNIDYETNITKAKYSHMTSQLLQDINKFVGECAASASQELKTSGIKGVVMVGGGSKMKQIVEIVQKSFEGIKLYNSIDPQEVIAIGCARQATILSKPESTVMLTDLLLLDVEPLSLGLETADGVMTTIIPRNATIPTRRTQTFTTLHDNQETMTFKIFEGEHAFTEDNTYVGVFDITGLALTARGTQTVDVTFEIDANGTLSVSAVDNADTHRKTVYQTTGFKSSHNYKELEEMIDTAEKNQEQENKRLERLEVKHRLEDLVHFVNSALLQQGNTNDVSLSELRRKNEEISEWLRENDNANMNVIECKRAELEDFCSKCRSTGSMLESMVQNKLPRVSGNITAGPKKTKKVTWW